MAGALCLTKRTGVSFGSQNWTFEFSYHTVQKKVTHRHTFTARKDDGTADILLNSLKQPESMFCGQYISIPDLEDVAGLRQFIQFIQDRRPFVNFSMKRV